ncbi:MAG: pyruvate kinase, partial [Gemmatimonadetes bacterium]|nr:pyruvate kinase [Gemmatimonadota bacterium]
MPIYTARELLDRRRTKIVATLGPASSGVEILRSLVDAGVSVFRLNLSHGDTQAHEEIYRTARRISHEAGKPIGVLADLPGPKLRIGSFEHGSVELETGANVLVTTRDVVGSDGVIPSKYSDLAQDLSPEDNILLDDGR